MNQHTDQQLRKKMEAADPLELVSGFDLDKGWQEVQLKNKSRAFFLRNNRVIKALPYAAILLLGFLLSELIRPGVAPVNERIVAVRAPHTTILVKDTLYPVVPAAPTALPVKHITAVIIRQERKQDTAPQHKDQPEEIITRPADPAPVYAVTQSLPVVHYTDIISVPELQPGSGGVVQKKGFWHSRVARQKSSTPQKEQLPLRGLVYALNQ